MSAYLDYRTIDVAITPSDAAYTANDVVGGLLTFNMYTTRGMLFGVNVAIGEASIAVPGTFYFYSAQPSTIADNAAFAPTHADNEKLIGSMLLPTASTLNSFNVYLMSGANSLSSPLYYATDVVYAYYVTSGTPNFTGAAQDINVRLIVLGEK